MEVDPTNDREPMAGQEPTPEPPEGEPQLPGVGQPPEDEPEPTPEPTPQPTPEVGPARDAGSGRLRRYLAAFASSILPGLGHLAYGRRLLAVLFLAPTVGFVIALVAAALVDDRARLAARLVDPSVLAGLIFIQLVVLAWRLLAVGSNLLVARPPRYGPLDMLPILLLAAFIVVPQAYLLAVTNVARETAIAVFSPADAGPVWRPSTPPSPTPVPSSAASGGPLSPSPVASPGPSPTPASPRITVLLIGEDSGVGRNTALTDTMIVASLDPVGRTVSMLSVPRDLVDAPIPGGGTWQPKINGLAAWVRWHPDQFPGSNGVGQAVLAGVIGELIGVPIDYWAQVNLGGLIRVVDTVGGVDVTVAHAFCDPGYDEYGQQGFGVPVGRWHLNGSQALAYSRVRKAAGESDFTRAARQQEVLVGLRDALFRGGFFNDPVGFLQAIGQTVRTNVPPGLLPEIATYAERIGRDRVFRTVIAHPLVRPGFDVRGSIQIPDIPAIRALAAGLFPPAGVTPTITGASGGTTGGTGSGSGTAPTGSPSPTATTAPTATPGVAKPAGRAPNLPRIVCRAPKPTATPKPTPTASPSLSATPLPGGSPSASPGGSIGPDGSASPPASGPPASSEPTTASSTQSEGTPSAAP